MLYVATFSLDQSFWRLYSTWLLFRGPGPRVAVKIEGFRWYVKFLGSLVLWMVRMGNDRTGMRLVLFSKISTKESSQTGSI